MPRIDWLTSGISALERRFHIKALKKNMVLFPLINIYFFDFNLAKGFECVKTPTMFCLY